MTTHAMREVLRSAMTTALLPALALAVLLGLPAAAGAQGVTDAEVTIGSCAALTGPASYLGTQTVQGAQAYLNSLNDAGGVHGRKVKLVSRDDGYEPDKTIACVNQLIQQDKVFGMAFFVGTPTGAKAVPMAEAQKVPVVGFFTGARSYFFRAIFTPSSTASPKASSW